MTKPLDAALAYAALGWPVLPVGGDDGKKPLIPKREGGRGVLDATTDPEQLRRWWARWPKANVAIATGAPGPDVLDIDDSDRADDRALAFDGSRVATTRGLHVYFKGTEHRTVKLPYGELRRKGSYVIAPPSVRPDTGHVYAWIGGDPAADGALRGYAPDWLTEGRSTAGTGVAPSVGQVEPGAMYDHLLDFAVRLARGGVLDPVQREHLLFAEFERVRIPGASYGGSPDDTRRLANAPADILERELAATLPLPPTGGGQGLEFQTPAELRENLPPEPDWIWHGNVAAGFITVVGGRPKVGKSTVVYAALDALVTGAEMFLGSALYPTDVVLVSEEHAVTALDKLSDSPRLHVLTRDAAWPLPDWPHLIGAALAEAKRTGSKLLLIDSFTFWAGMEAEAGQDANAVQRRMEALLAVAREGIGVVLIHHQRKAGGDFGDALLGSTAFAANADFILEVERVEDAAPSMRKINRVGRWYVPPVLLVTWDHDAGYTLVAEAESTEDAEDHIWRDRILNALRPWGTSKRNTELSDLLGADSRRWGRAMNQLMAEGAVVKTGAGVQKDPFTYTSVAPDDRPTRPEI